MAGQDWLIEGATVVSRTSVNIKLIPVLRKRLARVDKRLLQLQTDTTSDAIHDCRVACRELLAYQPLLQAVSPTRYWRKRIRRLLTSLNPLRDLQQMREYLQPHATVCAVLDEKIQRHALAWQAQLPRLVREKLLDKLANTSTALLASPEKIVLETWVAQWQCALRRTQQQLSKISADKPKSLHRLRIRFKRLRYLAELLHDAGGCPALERKTLRHWQSVLGEIQDYRVMLLCDEVVLPAVLEHELQQHYNTQVQLMLAQQTDFAIFLTRLNQQIMTALPKPDPDKQHAPE